MDPVIFFSVFLVSVFLLKWVKKSLQRSLPLPPGPKGYPFIGNLLQMPSTTPWKTFDEWSKIYGDTIYLDLPNQPTVVLNSASAATDLLEKRSDIYSDRPISVMQRLMFWDWNPGFQPYSQSWRDHRREFHQFFNQHEVTNYLPIQLRECRAFLRRMLNSPKDLGPHVRHMVTAIILKITFDTDVPDLGHEYVLLSEEAVQGLSSIIVPGMFWVDYFPILEYIPRWVPGFQFKKQAEYYKPIVEKMRDKPFDDIVQNMKDGKGSDCLTSSLIERLQQKSGKSVLDPTDDTLARNVAGVAYAAAADTTTGALYSFLIGMSLFPEVQRKARDELERVIGPNRLPEFNDYDDLVYIQAVALESMRWMVVVPLGIYHRVTQEDEYKGYVIPKGATIIPNIWAMLHSPEDYSEPRLFNPDRFIKDGKLNPDVRDPLTVVFGFGRRVCPGRHLSGWSLFMAIASILHTFNINPIPGEDGKEFDPFSSVSTGLVAAPENIPCKLVPRSEQTIRLVRGSSE